MGSKPELKAHVDISMPYADGEVSGVDSLLFPMPPELYVKVDENGPPALVVQGLIRRLRSLVEREAARMGELIQQVRVVVSTDPETVRFIGMTHDCPDCLVGTERALEMLREHPDQEMVCVVIFWLKQPGQTPAPTS